MNYFQLMKINNFDTIDLNQLINESIEEGFGFLTRLVNDYKNGTNTFNKFGEALYGVFNVKGVLVAIGGLNIDPFSSEQVIGRIRRVCVCKEYRRSGIGSMLLTKIIEDAKDYYHVLVLFTDTKTGALFYSSHGFLRSNMYSNSTHYKMLK